MIQSLFGWRVTKEVSAKVNCCWMWRSCAGGCVGQAATNLWSFMNQTAARIQGRDLREQASSFYLGDGRGSYDPIYLAAAFVSLPGSIRQHGTHGQDHYRCSWSTLRREGAGRSWVTCDASNLPGVEQRNNVNIYNQH